MISGPVSLARVKRVALGVINVLITLSREVLLVLNSIPAWPQHEKLIPCMISDVMEPAMPFWRHLRGIVTSLACIFYPSVPSCKNHIKNHVLASEHDPTFYSTLSQASVIKLQSGAHLAAIVTWDSATKIPLLHNDYPYPSQRIPIKQGMGAQYGDLTPEQFMIYPTGRLALSDPKVLFKKMLENYYCIERTELF